MTRHIFANVSGLEMKTELKLIRLATDPVEHDSTVECR